MEIKVLRLDNPTGKVEVSLRDRLLKAINFRSKTHVSIHCNAWNCGPYGYLARGVETFTHTNPSSKSVELAHMMQRAQVKASGLIDRGVKRHNFFMCREFEEVGIPSVLVENGFYTNPHELDLLKSHDYQLKMANVYANTIIKYCNDYNIDRITIDAGHSLVTKGKRSCDGKFKEWEYNSVVVEHIIQYIDNYNNGNIEEQDYYFIQLGAMKSLEQAEKVASELSDKLSMVVGIKRGKPSAMRWIKTIK